DLLHLREAVRDTIEELGYAPVLSEYGGVGYLPTTSAEEACYQEVQNCQLAVLIIGKRYGSIGANGLSVTHNEFRAARERGIPVFALVDEDVLSFGRVQAASGDNTGITFPGMDSPDRTFELVKEVRDAPV